MSDREVRRMARKVVSKGGRTSRVTFELLPAAGARRVQLCGEFNGWSTTATPLAERRDGRFSVTLTLPTGSAYRYRFLVDGDRWENDWAADGYVRNGFGEDDSVTSCRSREAAAVLAARAGRTPNFGRVQITTGGRRARSRGRGRRTRTRGPGTGARRPRTA